MLEIKDVKFSYGKNCILNNVNLQILPGTCTGIIGRNGCGKSTLLSVITGIRKPDTGTIIKASPDIKIGYIPQDNPLMPDLSGYDNMLLWYEGSKKQFENELKSPLIDKLGINKFIKKPVKALSGGMKKKISIAMTLISHPDIVVLDEPSAALDIPTKTEIDNYLAQYISDNHSIIITTHDEAELNICTDLYAIQNNTLVKCDKNVRGEALLNILCG